MSSTSSPFGQNEWLVEEMYRKFRDDPSSVDESWHEFLVDYNPEPAEATSAGNGAPSPSAPVSPPEPRRPRRRPPPPRPRPRLRRPCAQS